MLAPYDLSIDKRRQILCVLFPPSLEKLGSGAPAGNVPPFTADELECATVSMKPGKAPGLDKLPPEAIREVASSAPNFLLRLMNSLIVRQEFPDKISFCD
ncbi:hypothetical protein QE152_g32068 [Popillia japonica]|uniref:Reverse transcriptase n=1 Tax=Popillia japonica TaxID=7064 RepID=A0AAW1J0V2_POPJA